MEGLFKTFPCPGNSSRSNVALGTPGVRAGFTRRQRAGLESAHRGQSQGVGHDPDRDSFFLFLSRTKTFPVMTPCANPPRQKCRPFLSASGLLRGVTRESFGRVRRRSREPGQEREQPEAAGGGPAGPGLLGGPGRGRHCSQPCSLHLLPPRRRNQGCRRGQRPRGTTRPRAGPPPPEGPRLQVVRLSHWKPDQGRTPSTRTLGIVTRLL